MTREEFASLVMEKCRENGAGGTEESQILCVAEEVGEFVGAMRRWRGMARRSGTEREAMEELADIVLSAYAMADVMDWDLSDVIEAKASKILSRGWKEVKSA